MCNLPTDLRSWRAVAVALAALMLFACRGTPATPGSPAKLDERARVLQEIADYSLWVRQQPDDALRPELDRLQSAPESPGRSLRMALIAGQRQSALHDPDRAAQLLARVAGEGPEGSVYAQLAQALLGVLPSLQRQCAAAECEAKLTTLVELEELRRRELSTRIDSLRGQLESERREREKLESQLEALKSLEAQIKNRDGPQRP